MGFSLTIVIKLFLTLVTESRTVILFLQNGVLYYRWKRIQYYNQVCRLNRSSSYAPKWALGFSQCEIRVKIKLVKSPLNSKLQFTCIYQDIGWTEFLQNFEGGLEIFKSYGYDQNSFDMGFHIIVSQNPVISQENSSSWEGRNRLGLFVKDIRTGKTYDMPWPWGGSAVVDFTNLIHQWWGDYQQKAIDDGVDGFWTDMGEPAWVMRKKQTV